MTDVETKRLDDFAIANCSFIKIDVEGHEEAVLDGASALIAAQRPVLMIELDESLQSGRRRAPRGALCGAVTIAAFFCRTASSPDRRIRSGAPSECGTLKPRHKLPRGAEYINNFVFVPEEKARALARAAL